MFKKIVSFVILTLLIILGTGLYVWYNNKDNISTLTYLQDVEWSKDYVIGENFKSGVYDWAVDQSNNLHFVWVKFNTSTEICELFHSSVTPEGKTISSPTIIVSNKKIPQVSLNFCKDKLHIFWIGEGNTEKLDLYYTTMDLKGRVNQKVVLTDEFRSVKDFKTVSSSEGEFMLAWSDKVNMYHQIKTLFISSSNIIDIGRPVQITTSECNNYQSNLVVDKEQRYHLVWREELPRQNKLFYQRLNTRGEVDSVPIFIDNVFTGSASMLVSDNNLYMVWNNGRIWGIRELLNKLYGTVLDLNNLSDQIEIHQLTKQYGSLYNPALGMDSDGKIHLVYEDIYKEYGSLAHQVYKGDFTNEIRKVQWIYPDEKLVAKTKLLNDSGNDLHLIWYETDEYGGYLHYANTIGTHKITPLEIIGVDRANYIQSFIGSLAYIIFYPLYYLPFTYVLVLSLIFISTIAMIYLKVVGYFDTRCLKQAKVLQNIYLATILIFILYIAIFAILDIGKYVLMTDDNCWPLLQITHHYVFIFGFTFLVTMIYIAVNKVNETEVMNAMFVAYAWVYWIFLINTILNLPLMNFINVPSI